MGEWLKLLTFMSYNCSSKNTLDIKVWLFMLYDKYMMNSYIHKLPKHRPTIKTAKSKSHTLLGLRVPALYACLSY